MRLTHSPRLSPPALALVVLAHVGVMAGIVLSHDTVTSMPTPEPALMVDIIAPQPAPVQPPKPEPTKTPAAVSKPRPRPVSAPPVLATDNAPTPDAPVVQKAPTLPTPVQPTPSKDTPTAAAPSATVAPPAPAVVAPRFDAAYLDNPAPVYPPLSRRADEQGRVVLKVFVEASGTASHVEVRTSSGFERLDKAAVAAVSRWKFVPARQGQEAVAASVLVPIVFSLKD